MSNLEIGADVTPDREYNQFICGKREDKEKIIVELLKGAEKKVIFTKEWRNTSRDTYFYSDIKAKVTITPSEIQDAQLETNPSKFWNQITVRIYLCG
jgi:hypothetical protein